MGGLEFKSLPVTLPPPIDAPWKAAFFDSDLALGEWKSIALEVLPEWIRNAVFAGDSELAGRYLATLIKLANDGDLKTSSEAVFSLYRLGDSDGIAVGHIKRWIEKDIGALGSVTNGLWAEVKDIRAIALDVIRHDKNEELLDTIYKKWSSSGPDASKHSIVADYGYFLETHGKPLPADYWFQRLQVTGNFGNTIEVLEQKRPPEVVDRLKARFQQLSRSPAVSNDAGYAAMLASSLFRLTAEPQYREYLEKRVAQQLDENRVEGSLDHFLTGLGATNDLQALPVIETAMKHKNSVVREWAYWALGNCRLAEATEMLYKSAVDEATSTKLIPVDQLAALLTQRLPEADAKYEELKAAILGREFGFFAPSNDFSNLEYYRKLGRKTRPTVIWRK
jgi:hypothetical protein